MMFHFPPATSPELTKIKEENRSVILFGAGNVAKATLLACQKQGISVKCFCDTYWSTKKSEFMSYPLHPAEFITPEDTVVICSLRFLKDLREKLSPIGCTLVDYYQLFSGTEWSEEETEAYTGSLFDAQEGFFLSRYDNGDNIVLRNLNLDITEKCTLCCDGCGALVDYISSPQNSSFEQDKPAIEKALTALYVLQICILGGEPLCHPDLDRYICFCDQFSSFARLSIFTNATIMPNEKLLEAMRGCSRLIVNISDYGAPTQKIEQLCQLLHKNHILYAVLTKDTNWVDYGGFEDRKYTEQEMKDVFSSCFAKDCVEIKDGKWFHCVRIAHQYGMQAIPQEDCEYVDLLKNDVQQIQSAIRAELAKSYLKGCRYCSGGGYGAENTIQQGVQCKDRKPYTRYEYN